MAREDTSWYDVVEGKKGRALKKLVKCNYFASAFSAAELADVEGAEI